MQKVFDLGFSQKQAERLQTLADNKEVVEEVLKEAKAKKDTPMLILQI